MHAPQHPHRPPRAAYHSPPPAHRCGHDRRTWCRRARDRRRAGAAVLRDGRRSRPGLCGRGQLPHGRARRPPAAVHRLRAANGAAHGRSPAGRLHVPRQRRHRRAVPGHVRLARAGRRDRAGRRVPGRAALPRARDGPTDDEVERLRPRGGDRHLRAPAGLGCGRTGARRRRRLRRHDDGRHPRRPADRRASRVRVRVLQRRRVHGAAVDRTRRPTSPRPPTPAGRGLSPRRKLRRVESSRPTSRSAPSTAGSSRSSTRRCPSCRWTRWRSSPTPSSPASSAITTRRSGWTRASTRPSPRHTRRRSAGPRPARWGSSRCSKTYTSTRTATNNPNGFAAAPEFWDFFRAHRLP